MLQQVTTYFFTNVPTVISAFLFVAVFFWMLKIAFASLGINSHSDFLDVYMGANEHGYVHSEEMEYQDYAQRRDKMATFQSRYDYENAYQQEFDDAYGGDPYAGM